MPFSPLPVSASGNPEINLFSVNVKVKVVQSCLTLCDPMDYTLCGILQARKWVAFPFSRRSSQSTVWTPVSCIAGGFFISWATREAQEYWSGQPIPSPLDLPDPGIEPGSPALQADSLPTELSGKPQFKKIQFILLKKLSFFLFFIYWLIIFGYTWSSLVGAAFSSCCERGLLILAVCGL